MTTRTLSSYKKDTRIGNRVVLRKACIRHSILFEENPASVPEARKYLHTQFEGVHQCVRKNFRIRNGRTTQTLLILQKPTGSRRELDEELKEQRQRWFKVSHPKNRGAVRGNVIDTCTMCPTRCPMAGQRMRNIWSNIRWTFGSRLEPTSSTSPSLRKTRCISLAERRHPNSSWEM